MKYVVTGPLCTFGPGQKMRLTDEQIDARRYGLDVDLEDEKPGVVVTTMPMQFKRGEVVELEEKLDEMPGIIAGCLAPLSKRKASDRSESSSKPVRTEKPAKETSAHDDIDQLEASLEAAENAFAEAVAGMEPGADYSEAQLNALEVLNAAKAAYAAHIGEE